MKPQFTPKTYLIHATLFLLSIFTTLLVGTELTTGKIWAGWGLVEKQYLLQWTDLAKGVSYSLGFLLFLTFHEFGHFFAALYHRVRTTLPFYIPFYIPLPGILNIGSFGAVIVLKQIPDSSRKFFDIGIAGPLAGFVVSVLLLVYGFSHLPPMESYVLGIHPEYQETFGGAPSDEQMKAWLLSDPNRQAYVIGTNFLFEFLKNVIPSDPSQVPGQFEIMHYPLLFVGYITLFFTALNLLPIGQLDGGHIIYGMFGRKTAGYISRIAIVGLLLAGGTGYVEIRDISPGKVLVMGVYALFLVYIFSQLLGKNNWKEIAVFFVITFLIQMIIKLNFPSIPPNFIWIFYSFLVLRFVKPDHPAAYHEHRVNLPRQILGWVAILIFVLCFTPSPIQVVGGEADMLDGMLNDYLSFVGSSRP
ncbi:MAG: site-2 protease family protein [Bacteroidia bacterium]|nr:site-2 protease family protein [Bacteroidia bacterium]